MEFQLPEDIRTYFKDGEFDFYPTSILTHSIFSVGSGPKGNYINTAEYKPPRQK